jgi:hypothetical protein
LLERIEADGSTKDLLAHDYDECVQLAAEFERVGTKMRDGILSTTDIFVVGLIQVRTNDTIRQIAAITSDIAGQKVGLGTVQRGLIWFYNTGMALANEMWAARRGEEGVLYGSAVALDVERSAMRRV